MVRIGIGIERVTWIVGIKNEIESGSGREDGGGEETVITGARKGGERGQRVRSLGHNSRRKLLVFEVISNIFGEFKRPLSMVRVGRR